VDAASGDNLLDGQLTHRLDAMAQADDYQWDTVNAVAVRVDVTV
jgi:hypothetical protein